VRGLVFIRGPLKQCASEEENKVMENIEDKKSNNEEYRVVL
jgi:hypothetical protein